MIKRFIGKVHLWLGLASAIIVLIVSLTGCIYVFSREITEARRYDAMHVTPSANGTVSVSKLWETVQNDFGAERKIGWANVYNSPDKSWGFYSYKGNPDAITYFGAIEYYITAYVDPYSGTIKKEYDEKYDFFNIIKYIHWSLLLNTPIGQPIVGWGTFIFVILLISGLVLWWPKSLRSAKNLFWIKWKKETPGYRKTYDLHNVLGFYSLVFALVIALTGMVWSFKWFQAAVYVAASGTTTPPDLSQEKSTPSEISTIISPMDKALEFARLNYSDAAGFRIVPPADSVAPLNIYVQQKAGVYYKTHELQFDQYSGELLKQRNHDEKNAGEKLITANYDIHVGAIWGMPGKILAFIISLICASLPVTGFMVWWNKKKKRRKPLFQ